MSSCVDNDVCVQSFSTVILQLLQKRSTLPTFGSFSVVMDELDSQVENMSEDNHMQRSKKPKYGVSGVNLYVLNFFSREDLALGRPTQPYSLPKLKKTYILKQ